MSIVDISAVRQEEMPSERTIEAITGEILEAKRVGGEAVLTIGRGLIEAKAMLSHGEWLPWLNEQIGYSERQAQRFMQLAREWTNPTTLSDLGASKALALLALPESERDAFLAEGHVINGAEKSVPDMSVRELEQAIKERDAARLAREQAETDRALAEQARDKLSQEIQLAAAAKRQAEEALERARREAADAAENAMALEKELAELKARPVEVAVEVDQAALEDARIKGQLLAEKEFKKAQKEAQRQVSEANENAAQAKTEIQRLQRELKDLKFESQRQLDAARRAAVSPVTADAEVAQFKVYFDQVQDLANKMHGLLLKIRTREDRSVAEKLGKALLALSAKIGEAVS